MTAKKMKLTKAEKVARDARIKNLIEQGIEKSLATTMATVELKYGLIKPIVNF